LNHRELEQKIKKETAAPGADDSSGGGKPSSFGEMVRDIWMTKSSTHKMAQTEFFSYNCYTIR
jgi:hypothetical protein